MKRLTATMLAIMLAQVPMLMTAQNDGLGIWTSAGVEKGLGKGLDLGIEAEYRLQGSRTDSRSVSADVSKRLWRSQDKSFSGRIGVAYKFTSCPWVCVFCPEPTAASMVPSKVVGTLM